MSTQLPIVCAMRVCARNEAAFIAALEASFALDGQLPATLWLGVDNSHEPGPRLVKSASQAFSNVIIVEKEPPTDGAWPIPQNCIWQQTARWLDTNSARVEGSTHWLWWESDACPVRKGWLAALSSAVQQSKTPFAGVPCTAPDGTTYMNGVGLWPIRSLELLADTAAFYCRETPFDIAARYGVMRQFTDLSQLILHLRKAFGGSSATVPTREQFKQMLAENSEAVFVHGYDPAALLAHITKKPLPAAAKPVSTGRTAFYHSGDLGDIIYSLLTLRELGGGDIFLGSDNRTGMMTRERMTLPRAQAILPLLEAQPYIVNASYSEQMPEHVTRDLNQMRMVLRQERLDMKPGYNLARCYLKAFGLSLDNDNADNPWLHAKPSKQASVIIARSPRYQDAAFRWDHILAHYRGNIAFVGSKEEHQAFTRAWGELPHHPTKDLLELAQVIAGSELFIGNQSCPYAIAEGLKHPSILEACPVGSNTIFQRPNVMRGCTDATVFPRISAKPIARRKLEKSLVISGPVDWFTGLGRLTCQLVMEARAAKLKVSVQPTSRDDRLPIPAAMRAAMDTSYDMRGVPRLVITPLLAAHKHVTLGDAVFTMWESTRLPLGTVEVLNSRASLVIVPSRWCATVFSANGVIAPIHVVPLGVDRSVFCNNGDPKPKQLTFGAAGRLAHGGTRKGIEDVIAAFQLAFPERKDVRLRLKLHSDSPIPSFTDKRIRVGTDLLDDASMANWYCSLSCFVSAAKGEGWGLHVQEAIACGIPVLAPAHSGLADLVEPCVTFSLVPAAEGYEGHWHQTDVKALAANMALNLSCRPLDPARTESVETFEQIRSLLC